MSRKHVVVIGGGTGTFTVLSGLKKYPVDLTAIVAMSDNGGSTGVLRDELGVLPPGDVRQCLVALSSSDKLMRALMSYRFEEGTLKGHSFGNLFLSALEKVSGDFNTAVARVGEILRIEGTVIPATVDTVDLMAKVGGRIIRGEEQIEQTELNGNFEYLWLEPVARANPPALAALRSADAIVIGPGNLYASVVPNLLVRKIPEAIARSKAKKIFVCNLMTKAEHTDGYSVADHVGVIERYLGAPVDTVIYNNRKPDKAALERYVREHDKPVSWTSLPRERELIGGDFLPRTMPASNKVRTAAKESSLVRHDQSRLAAALAAYLGVARG